MEPSNVETTKSKKGNSVWVKGGLSPNPAGRPKGTLSVAPEVKESIIKAFNAAGGPERMIRIMKEGSKRADQIFISFVKNILIPLLPKRTEMDIEHRSVTFVFGDGSQETFKSTETEGVMDIEAEPEEK